MIGSSKELKHKLALNIRIRAFLKSTVKRTKIYMETIFMFQFYEICLSLLSSSYMLQSTPNNSNIRGK